MFKVVEVFHYVLSQDAFFLDLKKKRKQNQTHPFLEPFLTGHVFQTSHHPCWSPLALLPLVSICHQKHGPKADTLLQ